MAEVDVQHIYYPFLYYGFPPSRLNSVNLTEFSLVGRNSITITDTVTHISPMNYNRMLVIYNH